MQRITPYSAKTGIEYFRSMYSIYYEESILLYEKYLESGTDRDYIAYSKVLDALNECAIIRWNMQHPEDLWGHIPVSSEFPLLRDAALEAILEEGA